MKKLKDYLFSMVTTVILMTIFGISIGYATFAESSSGTEYAKQMVYNAKWFEVLMVLLIVNLSGSIFRYDLINKRKWSILLFHLAFICILIGAGVTRFLGSEGIMHIRQGETSNEISSDKSSVRIIAEQNGKKVEKSIETTFSETSTTNLSESLDIDGKKITVENELFVPNSVETIEPDEQGEPALSLFVMNQQNKGEDLTLLKGENTEFNGLSLAFDDSTSNSDINLSSENGEIYIESSLPLAQVSMMENNQITLTPGTKYKLAEKTLYKTENTLFVLKNFLPKAKKSLTQFTNAGNNSGVKMEGNNAIIFNVSDGTKTKSIHVFESSDQIPKVSTCNLNGVKVSISYGMLSQKLPFSITLRKFELERYPGSNSPSSYASEITVTDYDSKIKLPFRIFMNNILNYKGYRFFQSSYDTDELGTILSVNHDYWGSMITYFGYFFMMLGMVLTLFSKNSRFRAVMKLSNEIQLKRKVAKTLLLAAIILISGNIFATNNSNGKKAHLDALNSLLIQDEIQGRIEPLNTYASDVIRKITKKTTYKGQSSVEVLMGMSSNPQKWGNEPIIKIANEVLAKELAAINEYISFNQLFDFQNNGQYKLQEKVEKAYQKDPAERNQYEKELINVDERVNICNQIFSNEILTIFPVNGNQKWTTAIVSHQNTEAMPSMDEMTASGAAVCPVSGKSGITNNTANADDKTENLQCPVTGKTGMTNELGNSTTDSSNFHGNMQASVGMMHGEQSLNQNNITDIPQNLLHTYLAAFSEAEETGNWNNANLALLNLKNFQLQNGGNQLPSKERIKLEILYDKMSIFLILGILYGIIGLILLTLHIVNILKFNHKIDNLLNKSIYLFYVLFLLYCAGLILRWYISEHAPWSNGYESMIFVGWAAALSGLIFAKKSPITLSVTSLLSAITLSVAGMSWMNPEITNLVPVLKSYWLVIHVAVITSSYGFLAMAAMLGLLNLGLMIARTSKNKDRLNQSILEFSYIIEMALTIGLFMLTVGTFLGGVWANESWGRYWGWDPKETWALVSILVYASVLHLRKIPKANNMLVLNTAALLSFGSIIMTFLGVNYYLSGMHSYGQGTPPPFPVLVYFIIIGLVILVIWAYNSEKRNKQQIKK